MAHIYKYEFHKKKLRLELDLRVYDNDIIRALEIYFGDNLKAYRVEENFYEYRLFKSISNGEKRRFGSFLLMNCAGLREVRNRNMKYKNPFFTRAKGQYYCFVSRDNQGNPTECALVDKDTFTEEYIEHIQAIFYKLYNDANRELDYGINLLRLACMDIANLSSDSDLSVFKLSENDSYKREGDNSYDLYDVSVIYNENSELYSLEMMTDHITIRDELVDEKGRITDDIGLQNEERILIDSVVQLKGAKKKEIDEFTSIYFETATTRRIEYPLSSDINFMVYNVGQGLSTSLSEGAKPPFMFFDFGESYGENKFNLPHSININIKIPTTIILSHIHEDHWNCLNQYPKAFQADWIIPEKGSKVTFKKRCAEIIASGGTVAELQKPLKFKFGKILYGAPSKHSVSRKPSHEHEYGLSMCLDGDKKILVPGDQNYDYIEDNELKGIDILVASHHGGKYSWSSRSNVEDDLPVAKNDSVIIYSSGIDNTYKHPSKKKDYRNKGWLNEHRTAKDSDFSIKI